ncbi:hypothetical protein QCA50_008739 [Cerrena zonata]|uniref:Uncharacterized protein n=1 Tax=Cerrena zonata TaxID=2478898 RepID=A0AAW0GA24_9APHY
MFRLATFAPFILLLNAVAPVAAQFSFEIGTPENATEIRPSLFNLDLKKEVEVMLILGGGNQSSSIQQTTFENPCTSGGQGYFTYNYTFSEDADAFITVEFSKLQGQPPYWFSDGFEDHCKKGMVFAINPESDDQFNDFKSRATSGAAPLSATSSQASSASATGSGSATGTETPKSTDESKPKDDNDDGAMSLSAGSMLLVSVAVAVTAGWAVL